MKKSLVIIFSILSFTSMILYFVNDPLSKYIYPLYVSDIPEWLKYIHSRFNMITFYTGCLVSIVVFSKLLDPYKYIVIPACCVFNFCLSDLFCRIVFKDQYFDLIKDSIAIVLTILIVLHKYYKKK